MQEWLYLFLTTSYCLPFLSSLFSSFSPSLFSKKTGRTGRAGKNGMASAFLTLDCKIADELRRLLKQSKQVCPCSLRSLPLPPLPSPSLSLSLPFFYSLPSPYSLSVHTTTSPLIHPLGHTTRAATEFKTIRRRDREGRTTRLCCEEATTVMCILLLSLLPFMEIIEYTLVIYRYHATTVNECNIFYTVKPARIPPPSISISISLPSPLLSFIVSYYYLNQMFTW